MAFGGLDSNEIIEGFICPICMEDLCSVSNLTSHVDAVHNQEEKLPLQAMKDIFGKAKKKLLQPNEIKPELTDSFNDSYLYSQLLPIGSTRSHFDYFKTCRGKVSDRYAIETNKILIRLDKLITNIPFDPIQRKIHEKKVVDWVDDQFVGICVECGKSFGMARRRHHCRLCGAVICMSCSMFLSIEEARKMVESGLNKKFSPHPSPSKGLSSLLIKARNGSSGSLNSMLSRVDPNSEEFKLRICCHCNKLLHKRNTLLTFKDSTLQTCKLYDDMQALIQRTCQELPHYVKMCDSLNSGETQFTLSEAVNLQVTIMRQAEKIDKISKKIVDCSYLETEESATMGLLHKKIRLAATNFLKSTMLGLPTPPTEDRLQALVTSRKAANQRYLEAERLNKCEPKEKGKNVLQMIKDTGWGPSSISANGSTSEDPIVEQIHIIQEYIKQAREANKYDELVMLESNLKELKLSYLKSKESRGS